MIIGMIYLYGNGKQIFFVGGGGRLVWRIILKNQLTYCSSFLILFSRHYFAQFSEEKKPNFVFRIILGYTQITRLG